MKGNNTLHLNQSTMIEAMTYWLREQQLKENNFEVLSVNYTTKGGYDNGEFVVLIKSEDKEAEYGKSE